VPQAAADNGGGLKQPMQHASFSQQHSEYLQEQAERGVAQNLNLDDLFDDCYFDGFPVSIYIQIIQLGLFVCLFAREGRKVICRGLWLLPVRLYCALKARERGRERAKAVHFSFSAIVSKSCMILFVCLAALCYLPRVFLLLFYSQAFIGALCFAFSFSFC
jgi:hypothetical protein